jgi:hypothetical protein
MEVGEGFPLLVAEAPGYTTWGVTAAGYTFRGFPVTQCLLF